MKFWWVSIIERKRDTKTNIIIKTYNMEETHTPNANPTCRALVLGAPLNDPQKLLVDTYGNSIRHQYRIQYTVEISSREPKIPTWSLQMQHLSIVKFYYFYYKGYKFLLQNKPKTTGIYTNCPLQRKYPLQNNISTGHKLTCSKYFCLIRAITTV